MKGSNFYKYTIMVIAGFILGFLAGNYAPSIKDIMHTRYGLSDEEKEIVNQLDLYEDYELFKSFDAVRHILRSFFVSDAYAETASAEEREIIEELDLYEDYNTWEESSKDNEFFVEDIYNISEEEWAMLDTVAYIEDELLDYYETGKEGD